MGGEHGRAAGAIHRAVVPALLRYGCRPGVPYWFNDDDTPQLHGASGLTRNYVPKPSFYAVAHLLKTLGDARFSRVLMAQDGAAYAYEYGNGAQRILAVWSATGSGKTAKVTLPVGGTVSHAEAMPLAEGAAAPVVFAQKKGSVTLTVGESPIYLG